MAPRLSLAVLLAVCMLSVGASSSAATRATGTPPGVTETALPVSPTYEPFIAVDPVGQHVFVTGGEATSAIYVLDYDGNLVKTITGEAGASGMAVDTATHTLYVADYDATSIAEIDTQTLSETARFSTDPYAGPYDLALAGGKLWFATAANEQGTVVSANLDGSNMTNTGFGGPMLITASADGTLLAVGDHETEPSGISVYDVSGNSPALVSSSGGNGCEFVNDIAFDASAANVLTACGYPYYVSSLATSTGFSSFAYPTGPYPNAVTVSADGNYVAAGNSFSVFVYPAGDTTPVNSWAIHAFGHSLVFNPDGSRLFALSRASNDALALETIDDPTLDQTSTSLSGPESVSYGKTAKLTAYVTGTTTGTLELLASSNGADPSPIAFAPVNGSGGIPFTVKPTEKTTYSAELKAGSTYGASSSSPVVVDVAPRLSVTARPTTAKTSHDSNGRVALTGVIVPARAGERLIFSVARRTRGTWVPLPNMKSRIHTDGRARMTFHPRRKGAYRVEVAYNGDSRYRGCVSGWTRFDIG